MTPRERVLAAVAGRSADRIASNFRAEVEVFQMLQKALGLSSFGEISVWATAIAIIDRN
jgi:hypothetical protein